MSSLTVIENDPGVTFSPPPCRKDEAANSVSDVTDAKVHVADVVPVRGMFADVRHEADQCVPEATVSSKDAEALVHD